MPPRNKMSMAIASAAQPAAKGLRELLGPAPLLDGEDAAVYAALHDRIIAAVSPNDPLEEIWVRDVVDLLWETLRLRHLKRDLMASAAHHGLDRLLEPLVGRSTRQALVEGWAGKDRSAVRDVKAILKGAGLDERAIYAQTLAVRLDTFERIERLIMQTEARRNAALRELERRREALARKLREATREIEDAEFTEVEPRKDAAE